MVKRVNFFPKDKPKPVYEPPASTYTEEEEDEYGMEMDEDCDGEEKVAVKPEPKEPPKPVRLPKREDYEDISTFGEF